MRIQILYFAAIKELLGVAGEAVELDGSSTDVAGVEAHLVRMHPELEGRLASVRIAVNEAFAFPATRVEDGDTLALIPPVSGG
jgi:sulfur-carrier protein